MANFELATDLKSDALKLAGEPQDGSSDFDADVYGLLTSVQRSLISGGQFGASPLQPVDWPWARSYPRGVMQLQLPINGDYAISATFTQSSTTVALGASIGATSRQYWRVWGDAFASRPTITSNTTTSLTLTNGWAEAALVTARWLAFQAEYALPTDFVRFASPIFVSGYPYRIDVVEIDELEARYPFSLIAAGVPRLAAVVADKKLRFSHFLGTTVQGAAFNAPLQLEFEYIARPVVIDAGATILVPTEHRRVLSYGAAYMMLDDKGDSAAPRIWQRFQAQYKAMVDEFRRNLMSSSSLWGVVRPRIVDSEPLTFTQSGVIVRG